MNDILDEIEKPNTKKIFSILSFIFSLITFSIIIYIFFLGPREFTISKSQNYFFYWEIIIKILGLMGFVFTIVSYKKKEPSNKFKLIGTIINAIIFIFIVGAFVFSTVINLTR